jgi:hypothetical protein
MRVCKTCDKLRKQLDHAKNPEKKKIQQQNWYLINKEKVKVYGANRYLENREEITQANREKYKADKEKYRIRNRSWVDRNREKKYAINKKHEAGHPQARQARYAKHRAQKKGATPTWLTPEQLTEIRNFYSRASNLSKESGIRHHVDHIIPLTHPEVCGLHVPSNLQVLTESENTRKKNKFDGTWDNTGW